MRSLPEARLRPVGVTDVRIDDEFWSPRLETLREVTIDSTHKHLVDSGRIENFWIAAGEVDAEYNPSRFNDSDVFKWLEGTCYLLGLADDPTLRDRVDEVVDAIEAAQTPDGYLDSYYQVVRPDDRWENVSRTHELYNAGHLIEAAVAHHRATGEQRLLNVAGGSPTTSTRRPAPTVETTSPVRAPSKFRYARCCETIYSNPYQASGTVNRTIE